MDHMKKYPKDFSQPLLVLLEMLSRSNVNFFVENQSWFTRNWRYFYLVPAMIGHYTTMSVPIARELVAEKVLYDVLSLPIYIVSIQVIFKTIILLSNKHRLENIIEELGHLWRTDGLNDKQKAVKKAKARELRFGVIAYLRFTRMVTWQFLLLPLVDTVVSNVVLGEHQEKRLPMFAEYPFDPYSSWLVYSVTYVYQIYCLFIMVYIFLGSDFTIIALSAHLSTEFLLLREDLRNFPPDRLATCARDDASLLSFVRRHQKLIVLAQELDAAINKLMFVNVLFTTLNVSFFGLSALEAESMADKLTFTIIVLTVLMLMLVLCYFGEKLKTASEAIFEAACEHSWYEGDIEYQKVLHFIMLRSQKPCYLTSWKYTKISLQTFTKVLSTTWSYFSLINKMYQRRQ